MTENSNLEAFRVDDRGDLRVTSLGRVKISRHLLDLVDQHIRENGIKNRSVFIRGCIIKELNLSLDDIINSERPFMPLAPDSLLEKMGLK